MRTIGDGTFCKQFSYEDYKKLKMGRQRQQAGVLELMAHTCSISMASEILTPRNSPFMQVERAKIPLAPRIVAGTDASTLFTSVDTVVPELSIQTLAELLQFMKAICVDVGGDIDALPPNTAPRSLFLLFCLGCFGHVIHNITEAEFNTDALIPKLHSTTVFLRRPLN